MEEEKKLIPNGGYPMHTIEDLETIFYPYITNQKDRSLVLDAYHFASEKHAGVLRKSGEPYIQHPIEVAYICAQLQAGPATLAAAFLHDVVEDTDTPIEEIRERFGDDVALIVDSLTKIQRMKLSHMTAEDFEAEDHRKIFLGMAHDVRVIIVKLADRLHNMRTLDSLSPVRQHALAKETLEVFTPIAHRLGIYTIQSELEDLSLKYLEPDRYRSIKKAVDERFENTKNSLMAFKKRLADLLFEQGIRVRMESRVKSIYSIYRKMYRKGYSFDEIYDVLAIRIICDSVLNCYEILGIVHATYKPIPGRFKDYIAMPKPNMYQSLHTSVISGDGAVYEVQIRTEEMDQIAETGVAAHWRYKETGGYNAKEEQKEIEEQLHWFREFVSLSGEQNEATAKEYMASLTNDIFEANVYVFTPLGKVIELPQGATTLDFAYRIHSKVGDSATGAVVNGVLVPLNTVLKTGDVCEIRTSKTAPGPNESWLSIAKTASAQSKIKKALQKKDADILRQEHARAGRQSMMDSFRIAGYSEEEAMRILDFEKLKNEYHIENMDDFFVLVSGKNPAPNAVLSYLKVRRRTNLETLLKKKQAEKGTSPSCPVEIPGGSDNLAITLGHCCTPIPGDDIVGYITKGAGITIHRRSCPNIANETKRLLDARWKEDLGISSYRVDVVVFANDRPNLVADILTTVGTRNVLVSDLTSHLILETMNVVVNMTISVSSAKALQDVFADLLGVKGIYSVSRVSH